jgi:hypothetical protein
MPTLPLPSNRVRSLPTRQQGTISLQVPVQHSRTRSMDMAAPSSATAGTSSVEIYRQHSSLGHYRTTPISKHYQLNNTLLVAFESHYENHLYTIAYAIGLKFVETALLEIPKHGYFYSKRHEPERLQSSLDAIKVAHLLQEIIQKDELPTDELLKVQKLQHLAMKQYENSEYEEERSQIEKEIESLYANAASDKGDTYPTPPHASLTSTLLACGDSFSAIMCPIPFGENDTSTQFRNSILADDEGSAPIRAKRWSGSTSTTTSVRWSGGTPSTTSLLDDDGAAENSQVIVGVPVEEEIKTDAIPTKGHRVQSSYDDLQRALFLSGLQVQLSQQSGLGSISESNYQSKREDASAVNVPPVAKRTSSGSISMDLILQCYHEDFDSLRSMGRVRVSRVPTYQGRVEDSTNGCTVIAPLLCIHHFHNEQIIPDPGLPDQVIVEVIDDETPTILPRVRERLGLSKDAFLIPVDAHDSLMEEQYMCQEQFVTVCGGNLLDETHLQCLIDDISKIGSKKLAATLFFHDHVITILQLQRSSTEVWFDVLDSLPHEETLTRQQDMSEMSQANTADFMVTNSMGNSERSLWLENSNRTSDISSGGGSLGLDENGDMVDYIPEDEPPPNAARIRCLDAEALRVTLRWYACSVFTDENKKYIDTYLWDDKNSDFDPRIFQAFVWTEA